MYLDDGTRASRGPYRWEGGSGGGGGAGGGGGGVGGRGKPRGWRQRVPGELVSEALGTAIIILFGCGSVAMTVAALNQSDRGKLPFAARGDRLPINTRRGGG